MFINRIVMDVAVLPMVLFNPITIAFLLIAVTALILSVVFSARRRKKEETKLQEKILDDMKHDSGQ